MSFALYNSKKFTINAMKNIPNTKRESTYIFNKFLINFFDNCFLISKKAIGIRKKVILLKTTLIPLCKSSEYTKEITSIK